MTDCQSCGGESLTWHSLCYSCWKMQKDNEIKKGIGKAAKIVEETKSKNPCIIIKKGERCKFPAVDGSNYCIYHTRKKKKVGYTRKGEKTAYTKALIRQRRRESK